MEYGPLTFFLAVMAIGGLIASNQKISQLDEMSPMRRRLLGLFVIEMGGLAASAWTWMIHNQLLQGGSTLCAAEGVVQCGSVIGDPTYSEFFGVPWGVVGILAFSALGWLTLTIFLDMKADWAKSYAGYAWWLSLPSIPGIAGLVIVELFLVEGAPHICPYCTSVHIALIASMYLLYLIRKDIEDDNWAITPKLSKAELLAKARKK
jgi:uncharacterized membrane protein